MAMYLIHIPVRRQVGDDTTLAIEDSSLSVVADNLMVSFHSC